MLKHTKIVATISDKMCDVDFLQQLFDEGMNVVRMNSAHLDEEGFLKIINNVRQVSSRIALLVDTKGPEIRTTFAENDIILKTGDRIRIEGNPEGISSREAIYVSYPNLTQRMEVGKDILIDDGEVDLKVIEVHPTHLICLSRNDGIVGSRKSVNIPDVRIDLPSITEKDVQNILFAIKNNVDFIAHSFVRSKQDVLDVQKILTENDSHIKVIAKIENQEGVDNIDEILSAAYGIMVARGDLGIEVAQEKIPAIQRALIRKAIHHKKPVIVATQMLHSMIHNPRPTRAEITDIANAIYYRTDAVMLSGETAYGKYPVESVRTMTQVARETEKSKLTENDIRVPLTQDDREVTSFLAKQAVKSAAKLNVNAIVTDSHTGRTARVLAAFRGSKPVFAMTTSERLARELALSYGIWAEYQAGKGIENTKESRRAYYESAIRKLIEYKMIKKEDRVAYLGGSFGETGGTTYLDINEAWKVLEAKERYNLPDYTM
ncbi:MAG: pyruvate kinase [Dysgonamonadaceae bacterium]|jgi:pyruvate kinase|nr:pyruvate kinase [Dysgonamonadaceae bacterium]MDD3356862.1 pyruvate kinase [Dysgonamonadaceae bacterium]MDD3727504.1 pyruvate kinase [Dysgonamonadaceae bacterium]MDD4246231.1 pyruvate kinase [Dysgonamonadaceae bacterium]MDD4604999.1 pyruvate kinase [Dysgonamonadaceae bacterium]